MARRPLTVRKVRKPKVSHNEAYLINSKYLGDEPTAKDVERLGLTRALNWYSMMCDAEEARQYIIDHFKDNKDLCKQIKKVPADRIPTSAAWVFRIINRGAKLNEEHIAYSLDKVKGSLAYVEEPVEEKAQQPKPSIQDRIKDRAFDIIGEIEALIDTGEPFSLYEWLQANQVPAMYSQRIIEHYTKWIDELVQVLNGQDDQLKEAYKHMSKNEVRERIKFFGQMLDDCNRYGSNTKKVRKPRKPRAVSVEKKLKHFKYKVEDNDFKIASINPEKIIGAQELWVFNTSNKVVTVYRAIDRGGLQINRSSIANFDANQSMSKKTGRKPKETVEKILRGGKLILRKIMDEQKTDAKMQERINENTVLLRVV